MMFDIKKFPLAFKNKRGNYFLRSKEISNDYSPRYIVNPNSAATYDISEFKNCDPIFDKKIIPKNHRSKT